MIRNLVTGAVVLAIILGVGYLFREYQEGARATAPMLPVNFAHIDHTTVNCVLCHHNFIDSTGQGLCFDCHKTDTSVAALIETQFHDLCRDCHIEKQQLGEAGGPTRQCISCHEGDDAP